MILCNISLKPNSEQKHYFHLGVFIGMFVTIFAMWDLARLLGKAVIIVYFVIFGVAGLLAMELLMDQHF